jgi:hypothetical protein
MRILIYSDVHNNLPAFEQMLKEVVHCEAYISLGDLVNYGPWSNECVDRYGFWVIDVCFSTQQQIVTVGLKAQQRHLIGRIKRVVHE